MTIPVAATRQGGGTIHRMASTTPGRLQLLRVAILLGAIIFSTLNFLSIQGTRTAVETMGQSTANAVFISQNLYAKLVELDDAAASEFLVGDGPEAAKARERYERIRGDISTLITTAANDGSLNGEQRATLAALTTSLQEYNGLVERARGENRSGKPLGAGYLQYASKLMHETVMRHAQALHDGNVTLLDSQYESYKSSHLLWLIMSLGSGLLLLGTLGSGILYMSRRMNRTLNKPILIGALVVTVVTVVNTAGLIASNGSLSQARNQDFPLAHTLITARATAYDARTDRSHYLIARGSGQSYQDSLTAKVTQLSDSLKTALSLSGQGRLSRVIAEAARGHALWVDIDGQVKALDAEGKRGEAIALISSTGEGTAQFNYFASSMEQAISGAQGDFTSSINSSLSRVAYLEFVSIAVAILAFVLGWLGIAPRIAEFPFKGRSAR